MKYKGYTTFLTKIIIKTVTGIRFFLVLVFFYITRQITATEMVCGFKRNNSLAASLIVEPVVIKSSINKICLSLYASLSDTFNIKASLTLVPRTEETSSN